MDERIAKQFTISKASPVPLYFQLKTQLVELLKQGIFQAGISCRPKQNSVSCWIFRVLLYGRPFLN